MNPTLLSGRSSSLAGSPPVRPESSAGRAGGPGRSSESEAPGAGPGTFASMLSAHSAAGVDGQAAEPAADAGGEVAGPGAAGADGTALAQGTIPPAALLGQDVMQAVQATSPTLAHWLMQMAGMMQPVLPQGPAAGMGSLPGSGADGLQGDPAGRALSRADGPAGGAATGLKGGVEAPAWLTSAAPAGGAGAAGAGAATAGQALDEALADFEAASQRERAALPATLEGAAAGLSAGGVGAGVGSGAGEAAVLASVPHRAVESAGPVTQAQVHTPVGQAGFADELVQTAAQIAQQVHVAQRGTHEVTLHLHPTEMGPVTVAIEMNGDAARIEFGAAQAATREHLQASLPALAEALRADGLTLAHGAVSDQPGADHPSRRPASGQSGPSGRAARGDGVVLGGSDDAVAGVTDRATSVSRRWSGGLDLFA